MARSRESASGAAISCSCTIPRSAAQGFKHFRPIVGDKNGPLRRLINAEITKNPHYADFSLEQSNMSAEDFYDRMDDVMSPEPLDPVKAMTDAIASLNEQVKTRVTSVENGRQYQEKQAGALRRCRTARRSSRPPAPGKTTPRRRAISVCLIAIDVVRNFPDRFVRRSDRYAMPGGKSIEDVKRELQGVLASELAARKFSYTRSDGSQWTLVSQGRDRPGSGLRDGLQPERLRRDTLGGRGRQRGSGDLQAARAAGAARQDVVGLSHLVPRAALADPHLSAIEAGEE